MRNKEFVNCIW